MNDISDSIIARLNGHDQKFIALEKRLSMMEYKLFLQTQQPAPSVQPQPPVEKKRPFEPQGVATFQHKQTPVVEKPSEPVTIEEPKAPVAEQFVDPVPLPIPPAPPAPPSVAAIAPDILSSVTREENLPVPENPFIYTPKTPPAHPILKAKTNTFEIKHGGNWLLWLGGIILVMGLGFGAWQIQSAVPPAIKCLLATILGFAICSSGYIVSRTNKLIGRSGIAIGTVVLYFVFYAAGFIQYLQCIPPFASLILMALVGGVFMVLAERWKQEQVAGIGLCLANIPALLSAGTYGNIALLPIILVGLGGSFLIIRNQWYKLNVFSLLMSYGSIGGLAYYLSNTHHQINFTLWFTCLVLQWAMVIIGFGRWSKTWLQLQDVVASKPEHQGTIKYDPAMLPWSYAAKIANSLIFISLSITLYFASISAPWDSVVWSEFGKLLFLLAGLEAAQLLFPRLRYKHLFAVHTLTSMSLICGGILATTSGLNQAILLATQALLLAGAGTLSPSLRLLRPLSALPATLVLRYYFFPQGEIAFGLIDFLPSFLLLAGTLPIGLFKRDEQNITHSTVSLVLEYLSGNWRALIATVLYYVVLFHVRSILSLSHEELLFGCVLYPVGLACGLWLGTFRNWLAGFAFSILLATISCNALGLMDGFSYLYLGSVLTVILASWVAATNRRYTKPERWILASLGLLSILYVLSSYIINYLAVYTTVYLSLPSRISIMNGEVFPAVLIPALLFLFHSIHQFFSEREALKDTPFASTFFTTLVAAFPFFGWMLIAYTGTYYSLLSINAFLPAAIVAAVFVLLGSIRKTQIASESAMAFVMLTLLLINNMEPTVAGLLISVALVASTRFLKWNDDILRTLYFSITSSFVAVATMIIIAYKSYILFQAPYISTLYGGIAIGCFLLHFIKTESGFNLIKFNNKTTLSPALFLGIFATVQMLISAAFVDSKVSLIPASVITIILGILWIIVAKQKEHANKILLTSGYILPLFFATAVYQTGILPSTIANINLIGCMALTAILWLVRQKTFAVNSSAYLFFCAVPSCFLQFFVTPVEWNVTALLLGLGGLMGVHHLLVLREEANKEEQPQTVFSFITFFLLLLIPVFAHPTLEPFAFTLYLGVLGLIVLSLGFPLRSALHRYTGITLLMIAVGRVFFFHLIDSDITSRVLAFIGTGLLLMIGGYLYGLLSKRFLETAKNTGVEKEVE